MSSNSLWAMSLSLMKATTWRWRWTPPFFALVITRSTTGLSALALASVVTIASAVTSDATRLPSIAFSWAAPLPRRAPRLGVPRMSALLGPQRQPPLVELLEDLVQGLLAEVGDRQEIVLGALGQLADAVDLGPLQAVPRPLGKVEVLDRKVQVRRAAGGGADVTELEPLGVLAHLRDQADQRAEGVARRRQSLPRGDRPVGLDVKDEAVVVRRLLHAGRFHRERHPPHGREDRVDRDDADGRRSLVALGRDVAPPPLHGHVHGQSALPVQGGDHQVGAQDLHLGRRLHVAGRDRGRASHVQAQRDGLVGVDTQHQVLEVEDDVGYVLLHAREGGELVEGVVEADLRDGRAGYGGEQRSPQ